MSNKSYERLYCKGKGRTKYRRDLRLRKIAEKREIKLTRRTIGLIGPWNTKMLDVVCEDKHLSFNKRIQKLKGREISREELGLLMPFSEPYRRMSELDYD